MLNLLDKIDSLDKTRINNFIRLYGVRQGYIGNEEYLSYWAVEKKKLFKLLDGNLIYKVPYSFQKNEYIIKKELSKLYNQHPFFHKWQDLMHYAKDLYSEDRERRQLYHDFCYFLITEQNFIDNTTDIKIKYKDRQKNKTFQIQPGQKLSRAIMQTLNFFFPDDEDIVTRYKDLELKRSQILNTKTVKGNLCFSIHPLDFMTMSDNNSNWRSCLSWSNFGAYRGGTVELLNSNNVICVYIEGEQPYYFHDKQEPQFAWNDKKYRQLFICDKNIIISGKSYPYEVKQISVVALEILRELAQRNWCRNYQYGIEEYLDMKHIKQMAHIEQNRIWLKNEDNKKHNIIFDTKTMYNDMFNDKNFKYWCIRNAVPKRKIISISGKQPCLCCNKEVKELSPDHEYNDYNNQYSNLDSLVCVSCAEDRFCCVCGNDTSLFSTTQFDGRHVCSKCWEHNVFKCPDCGKPFISLWAEELYYDNMIFMRLVDKEELDYKNLQFQIEEYYCCNDCFDKAKEKAEQVAIPKPDDVHFGPFKKERWILPKTFSEDDDFFQKHHYLEPVEIPFKLKLDFV